MPEGNLTYKRGEIRWVNLNPVVGRETSKKRPCLILQNDLGNKFAPTTKLGRIYFSLTNHIYQGIQTTKLEG